MNYGDDQNKKERKGLSWSNTDQSFQCGRKNAKREICMKIRKSKFL